MKLHYLFILLCSISLSAQSDYEKAEKKKVIENIKNEIFSDTIKFNKNDLEFTVLGRKNSKSYSKLFCIDRKRIYKLDIIDNKLVEEFTNEILDNEKIETIVLVDKDKGSALFGENASNGVVFINIKKKTKYNPKVGGLQINKNGYGDNFSTIKKGEILIHH